MHKSKNVYEVNKKKVKVVLKDDINNDTEELKQSKLLSKSNYKIKSWTNKYSDNIVKLDSLYIHYSWKKILMDEFKKDYFSKVTNILEKCMKTNVEVFPYPDLMFNAFNLTPLQKVKVVILGQDPYFRPEHEGDKLVPQAMGLSFSIPLEVAVPSSLKNIYANMIKYEHMNKLPTHGNLTHWANQGVFMINAALTVQNGHANSHANQWKQFTNSIVKYLSNNLDNLVFVLWGGPALNKLELIDESKHKVIISSHPSGLSCHNTLKLYPSFKENDHFGKINTYLLEHNKKPILWNWEI